MASTLIGFMNPPDSTFWLVAWCKSSLSPEPSAFENRRPRSFDSRHSRRRLLGSGEVIQVAPLTLRRQRRERALETWKRDGDGREEMLFKMTWNIYGSDGG